MYNLNVFLFFISSECFVRVRMEFSRSHKFQQWQVAYEYCTRLSEYLQFNRNVISAN